MRSQIDRLVDFSGLVLSVAIVMIFLAAVYDFYPIANYRETGINDSIATMLSIALALFLLVVQAFGIVPRFTEERQVQNLALSIARLLIPIAILFTLQNHNDFPGVTASAEVRQNWAAKEFREYDDVMKTIKKCPAIVDRVGQVKFVAPTKGQNYVYSEPGSSGHRGELTLEVVGDKAIGVANSKFHIFTNVSSVEFTHQGKTERLQCK